MIRTIRTLWRQLHPRGNRPIILVPKSDSTVTREVYDWALRKHDQFVMIEHNGPKVVELYPSAATFNAIYAAAIADNTPERVTGDDKCSSG